MSAHAQSRPLHHQYFLAAIATVVTVGAGWGVWLLVQVGMAGRFTGVSLQDINAHGQAQIDGWVGLFIMGFALQMFPPVWHARLAGRRWRFVPLGTMLAGVVIRLRNFWTHATVADQVAFMLVVNVAPHPPLGHHEIPRRFGVARSTNTQNVSSPSTARGGSRSARLACQSPDVRALTRIRTW